MQHSAAPARIVAAGLMAVAALAVSTAEAGTVAIVNGTRTVMLGLEARAEGSNAWQTDVLARRTLGIQRQVLFAVPNAPWCYYDLKAMFEDGHRLTKTHVNLCGTHAYVLTDF